MLHTSIMIGIVDCDISKITSIRKENKAELYSWVENQEEQQTVETAINNNRQY